ncbi:MAG TPA: lytic murein transglycosylase [Beijerinckiaceae bacterium]|nr:lytic murein transglycosylase [Beijerinckiaceae bacterium]
MLRLKLACLALVAFAAVMGAPTGAAASPAFQAFVEGLWPEAQARGVSRATFDSAFRGVAPDPKIAGTTAKQSEFVRPVWHYIAGATAPGTVAKGQAAARQWAPVLAGVERTYGVPAPIVLALWGLESGYGASTGGVYTIRALATLAFAGNRRELFRNELLAALQILEQDHIEREAMLGSWAGAMGQTQFMPSSYLKFAVDGDGDGRRDIWTSVPDALASTANFMRENGWDPSLPWGFEVVLPEGFDWRTVSAGFPQWASLGVRRADGRAIPPRGDAALFLPAGAKGPALLITANFEVIRAYNTSDAYALGVGFLSDRIAGSGPLRASWPVNDPILTLAERAEAQKRLAALGLYDGATDGKVGPRSRDSVRRFQLARGLAADGYMGPAVLQALREAP